MGGSYPTWAEKMSILRSLTPRMTGAVPSMRKLNHPPCYMHGGLFIVRFKSCMTVVPRGTILTILSMISLPIMLNTFSILILLTIINR
jgi:hypothetical protein